MMSFRALYYAILLLLLLPGALCSQDLLDYSNSLKYADYLYKTRQYNLASLEFERVVFLEPKDTLSKLKLIRSYRYMTDYKTALNKIEALFPYNPNKLPDEFSDEYVRNLLYDNKFEKASLFLQDAENMNIGTRSEYQLGIYLMQYQWKDAKRFADENSAVLNKTVKYNYLNKMIEDGLNANYKSPFLAASISAVIPGGGKAYSGRWKDAIYSFIFVTTTSWLTVKSYQKNGFSLNSVLIGSFAVSFYSANIYGSVKSAKRYNQNINQSFRSKTESILLEDQE